MSFRIGELFERASRKADRSRRSPSGQVNAVYLVSEKIRRGGALLVHGPPGTGKTHVAVEAIRRSIRAMDEGETIVFYEAPTNQLAYDFLERVATIMLELGYSVRDIVRRVRLYGSKFNYAGFEDLSRQPDNDTMIVISTEWQRPVLPSNIRLSLIVDEASRTPVHTPFIPLANTISKILRDEEEDDLKGALVILGDPMQAIMRGAYDTGEYMAGKGLLLFVKTLKGLLESERVLEDDEDINDVSILLRKAREHLARKKSFTQLFETRRLPSPLHEPINEGYYDNTMRASESVNARLRGIDVNRLEGVPEGVSRAIEVIEEAVTTGRGLIVNRVRGDRSYPQMERELGLLIDPLRIKIGVEYAVATALSTGMDVLVTAPYVAMVQHMKFYARKILADLNLRNVSNLRFGTVQSVLGSESEAIVAVLGKEYISGLSTETIYFREPELLNVQLSREKKLLILVGNPLYLKNKAKDADKKGRTSKYRPLWVTSEKILEMCGFERDKSKMTRRKYDGDAGILMRID